MDAERFRLLTEQYSNLRIAVLGDFCLDRYLEIDPAKSELSLETSLPVHNVVNVRPQPGGAGTILNNLAALGVGAIYPIGFAGFDGEGSELCQALEQRPGVQLSHFVRTTERRTFTYCKPLMLSPGKPPTELNRLDFKNWTPTSALLQGLLLQRVLSLVETLNGLIILDQVDVPETGVVTERVLAELGKRIASEFELVILADSRRGLRGFPPFIFKMNAAELAISTGAKAPLRLDEIKDAAGGLAHHNRRSVFVTLAEGGMVGATAEGEVQHVPALPVQGEIDIVGAGDAVSANLTVAIAAGATLREALELANAAASVVIHKLGTTGTATCSELAERLGL